MSEMVKQEDCLEDDGGDVCSAQATVNCWNAEYSVGQPVKVYRDNGEVLQTVTRAKAQLIGGTAVTWVEGIAGCYALSHIRPVK